MSKLTDRLEAIEWVFDKHNNIHIVEKAGGTPEQIRQQIQADLLALLPKYRNPREIDMGNEDYERVKGGAEQFRIGFNLGQSIYKRDIEQAIKEYCEVADE